MRNALLLPFVALLCLTLAACGGGAGSDGTPTAPVSNFKILITDAPFPADLVQSATVVIREVRVRDQESGGWQTVFEGSASIDLVPLTGGVSELLVDAALEPGTYDEARLIVDSGEVVLKPDAVVRNGSHTFNVENGGLAFPSGAQTGIKVKLDEPIVVVSELSSSLTLDFDLSKNFIFNGPLGHAPGVGRVLFTPVVRAVNSTTAGSVTLDVLSDNGTPDDDSDDTILVGATVRALDALGDEAGSGFTGEDGFIELLLPAGIYTIEVEAGGHQSEEATDVEVFLANMTDLGTLLLVATSGEVSGSVMGDGGTPSEDSDDFVLEGVTVTATLQGGAAVDPDEYTDGQGAFRFEDLPLGTYDLDFTLPGYGAGQLTGVVPTLAGTQVSITLAALTRTVGGTVKEATSGDQLEGVAVSAVNAAGDEVATATTDASGYYSMSLPTGKYTVTFSQGGNSTSSSITVVGADPETYLTLGASL